MAIQGLLAERDDGMRVCGDYQHPIWIGQAQKNSLI